ncbi:MAG: prepilin-type N-terminal cleavage/methylation domain-containing protein [Candidatus Eisenbacteria bacterium]|nr:prepilin-type N-terminal cleavage/methylation domain-containing protein [Candidatus Eisenbacteria bacterium]
MTRDGTRGFSLVEVMIALTVLAVGIVAVSGMFPRGTSEIRKAKKVASASFAVQQTLEQLRTLDATSPALTAGAHPASGYDPVAAEPALATRYLVANMTGSMNGVKMVTVVVRWHESLDDSLLVVSYVRPQ